MKKAFKIILFLCLGFCTLATTAQNRKMHKIDWNKFKAQKISFLTEKLELTPEEAQHFWPIYNQFEKERVALHSERREYEMNNEKLLPTMSEKQAQEVIEKSLSFFKKGYELNEKYIHKVMKVLPAKKVVMLFKEEENFRRHIIKRYRDRGRKSTQK